MDFHGFPSMNVEHGKIRPAAPIESFARFQAGFLSSDDFHRISEISIDLHGFYISLYIFKDFQIFMDFGAWVLTMVGTCCPFRNVCSIPGWVLVI